MIIILFFLMLVSSCIFNVQLNPFALQLMFAYWYLLLDLLIIAFKETSIRTIRGQYFQARGTRASV